MNVELYFDKLGCSPSSDSVRYIDAIEDHLSEMMECVIEPMVSDFDYGWYNYETCDRDVSVTLTVWANGDEFSFEHDTLHSDTVYEMVTEFQSDLFYLVSALV